MPSVMRQGIAQPSSTILKQDTSTKLTGFTVTKDSNSLITRGCQRRLLVCSKLITKHATKSAVTRLIQLPGYHDNEFDNK